MLPSPCSSCGSPLPAVANDPHRPDLCAACAARSAGVEGPTVVPAPPQASGRSDQYGADAWVNATPGQPAPPRPVRTRPLDGILTGLAAAAVGGAIWWGVTSLTERQIPYLAVIVGVIVGQGVVEGTRKGGIVPGLIAGVCCLGALIVAQYFIERSLFLSAAQDRGVTVDLPLWDGFSSAKQVVQDAVEEDKLRGVFWIVAAVAAAVTAGSSGRRPVT